MAARAVQASKELLARLPSWRLLFQGRLLVLTNTLGGGVLMAVGDSLQQTREMRMEVGRVRDWRRTGKRGEGDLCWSVLSNFTSQCLFAPEQ